MANSRHLLDCPICGEDTFSVNKAGQCYECFLDEAEFLDEDEALAAYERHQYNYGDCPCDFCKGRRKKV